MSDVFDEHRSNVQDQAHWTSESLQHTARALTTWVVIPADHFPSRAHVICPTLFSTLLHKAFCTGEVIALCHEPAASFRAEVVTMIPPRLQQLYAWWLRLHAPLPTARILPKPTKDWLKARPIISFFRTWAAPLLTVFGAFPDVPGQLSVQELVHQLWQALSSADPTENIQLVSPVSSRPFPQSGFISRSRFYFIAMYEVKSDHGDACLKESGAVKQKSPGLFAKKTYSVSSTSSSTVATSRSMATCSGKNEALQWDPRLLLLFATLLLRLRIISGIRPWLRLGFKCQTLV